MNRQAKEQATAAEHARLCALAVEANAAMELTQSARGTIAERQVLIDSAGNAKSSGNLIDNEPFFARG